MGKSLQRSDDAFTSHEQGSRLWKRGGDLFALSLAGMMLVLASGMNGAGGLPAHASAATESRKSDGAQALDGLASVEVTMLTDIVDKSPTL